MALLDVLRVKLNVAMKEKDSFQVDTLRLIISALDKQQKDSGKPLDAGTEIAVLSKMVKQRGESIEAFDKGNRPDLANKERHEMAFIQQWLPPDASEQEIDAAIDAALGELAGPATGMKSMGALIKGASLKLAGKWFESRIVADKAKIKLQTLAGQIKVDTSI